MTAGKREPPLWLDMDFGEALARFGQTDPAEVAASVERAKEGRPPDRTGRPGGVKVEKGLKPAANRKR